MFLLTDFGYLNFESATAIRRNKAVVMGTYQIFSGIPTLLNL